jgi:hypothetical protein
MQRNRLQYHEQVRVERSVRDFIDRLLEPVAEDRFETAKEALSYLRRLRGGEPADHALARTDAGEEAWLSRHKETVLVEHRATPRLRFDVALATVSRIDEGLERAPGHVVLDLMPERVEMTFRSGMPTLRPEYTALGLVVVITLVLVIPMAWPAKIGSVLFLLAFGLVSARLFYRRAERRLLLTPQTYELIEEGRTLAKGDLAGLERVETSDEGVLLVEAGGDELVTAGGLGPDQGRWVETRLRESLAQLRRHGRLLEFDEGG